MRLKAKKEIDVDEVFDKFQFHIGAIKRVAVSATADATTVFQFHIGAIKRRLRLHIRCLAELVSIPYWCD